MEAFWFCIITFLLATYAILDGADLGAGVLHLLVVRTGNDRRSLMDALGPCWDGNEIWLLLAGGALYFAFPAVSMTRGFYLAAIVLLCMLILRGFGMEFRHRLTRLSWRRAFDLSFGVTGVLATVSFGITVGYVIRDVPAARSNSPAWFPLWCGAVALVVLTLQSALWMALKSSGELRRRSRRVASRLWWAALFCSAAVAVASCSLQPHLLDYLSTDTWIPACTVIALAGLLGTRLCLSVGFDLGAFAGVSCLIAGMLVTASTGVMTLYGSAPNLAFVSVNPIWWLPAFLLAIGYNVTMHRIWRNRLPHTMLAAAGK